MLRPTVQRERSIVRHAEPEPEPRKAQLGLRVASTCVPAPRCHNQHVADIRAELLDWHRQGSDLIARAATAVPSVAMQGLPAKFVALATAIQSELQRAAAIEALEANSDLLCHVLAFADVLTLCSAAQVRRAWRDAACGPRSS